MNFELTNNAGSDFVPVIHHDTYPAIDPTKFNLGGKTVLITGASKGIGRATALSFAKAGVSNIIIGARSSLEEVKKDAISAAKSAGHAAPKVLMLNLDVSAQASVEEAAGIVGKQFSTIDILINNAGFLEPWETIPESNPKTWWTSFEVNVLGTYLMCHAFLHLILKSETKIILNVTSYGAHRAAHGASAYQTSKLAVCRLTEFLMTENAAEGLIAFCAHPGGVMTELAKGMPEHMMSILIDTAELAGDSFVAWTEKRREWFAGRFLSVTWDLRELEGKKDEIIKGDLLKIRLDVESR